MLGNPTVGDPDADVERQVVAEVTAQDHAIPRDELAGLVEDKFEAHRVAASIDVLTAVGVIVAEGDHVQSSPALVRLYEIGLIPV